MLIEPMKHHFLHQHLTLFCEFVQYKCFWLALGFPQNTIANAKYLHIRVIRRTAGWHVISSGPLILCKFNQVPAQ